MAGASPSLTPASTASPLFESCSINPVGTEMIDTGNAQPKYYQLVALVHWFDARAAARLRAHRRSGVPPSAVSHQNGNVGQKFFPGPPDHATFEIDAGITREINSIVTS